MNLILNRVFLYFVFQAVAAEYFTGMTPTVGSYRLVTVGFSGSPLLHELVNKLYSYNDGKTSSI